MAINFGDIVDMVESTGLFSSLDASRLTALIRASELRSYRSGAIVLREGQRGDALFVVLEGAVEVFRDTVDGDLVLARLGPGEYLGEQALLPSGPERRTASGRALGHAVILRVLPETFRQVLAGDVALSDALHTEGREKLLRSLTDHGELFRTLSGEADFAAAVTERTLAPGSTLMREGEPADALYLVVSGVASVHRKDGHRLIEVAQVGRGQCVGELGIVHRRPRAATVLANTPLEVLRVDGDWFRSRYADSERLQAWMGTLEGAYQLGNRGLVTRHAGTFADQEALTSLFHFPGGRQVAVTQVVGEAVVNAQVAGAAATRTIVWEDAHVRRELRLDGETLLGLTGVGAWPALPAVMERLLDGLPITEQEAAGFDHGGDLDVQVPLFTDELLCLCLRVPQGDVRRALRAGCRDLASVQARTGCGTVCGGCVPALEALIGGHGFAPAALERVAQHTKDTHTWFLRLVDGHAAPARAGQRVRVRARIAGTLIERAYLITDWSDEGYAITVKREPLGVFSRWLFERPANGEVVWVSSPMGPGLPLTPGRATLCLVGGIGISVAMAVIRDRDQAPGGPVLIHHSARTAERFAFHADLDACMHGGHAGVVRLETERDGRLSAEDVRALVSEQPDAEVILCGPGTFARDVGAMLLAAGVPAERIHAEFFDHAGVPPEGANDGPPDGVFLRSPDATRSGPLFRAVADAAKGVWLAVSSPRLGWRQMGLHRNPTAVPVQRREAGVDPAVPFEARAGHVLGGQVPRAFSGMVDTVATLLDGPRACYFVRGRATVAAVLADPARFDRDALLYAPLRSGLAGGRGLLVGAMADNPTWADDRALAQALLGPEPLALQRPAFEAVIADAIREIDASITADPDRVIDLQVLATRLCFHMVFRGLAGDSALPEFHTLVERATAATTAIVEGARAGPRGLDAQGRVLSEAVAHLVRGIRDAGAAGRLTAVQRQLPLVERIVDGSIDAERLASVLLPIMLGGPEPSASIIARLLWSLGGAPHVEAAMVTEISDFCARHDGRGARPAEYVERPWTLAAWYETARRFPPIPTLARTARVAGSLPGEPGFDFPAGAVIAVSVAGIHHDARRYPQPDAWQPERFLRSLTQPTGQAVLDTVRTLQEQSDLLPFGDGPARCMGQHVALMQGFIVLDALLPRYRFEVVDPTVEVSGRDAFISAAPAGTLRARLRQR